MTMNYNELKLSDYNTTSLMLLDTKCRDVGFTQPENKKGKKKFLSIKDEY